MQISEILEMWLARRKNQSPHFSLGEKQHHYTDDTLVSVRSGDFTGATILFPHIYLQIPFYCQREAGKYIDINEWDTAPHDLKLV